jgi:chlorophyllide a reductase subunit Y
MWHRLPKTEWAAADVEWLEAYGAKVKFRASFEDDCAAMEATQPDLAMGTTPIMKRENSLKILGFSSPI